MEGIVAKRTLKKSYYSNKNINNNSFEGNLFSQTKGGEKNKFQVYKSKYTYKMCLQTISMVSIIIFVLAIKLLNIRVVLEADITKKITNYYQKTYSFNQIVNEGKGLVKSAYVYINPVIPKKIENKIKELYKAIATMKNTDKQEKNNEVKIYEESSISNKDNPVKENVGVSADVKENGEKIIAVSSSLSSEMNIANSIKDTKIEFVKPLKGTITSQFGAREVIFEGIDSYHTGTDIAANTGTKIVSSIEGTVTRATYNQYNGNFIEVTNGKIATIYCHMSKISVKVGDKVKAGTKIGEVGSTGLSTGPHLHFEIVYNGTKVDPELILDL